MLSKYKENEIKRAVSIIKGKAVLGPATARINVTGKCNQECSYCWIFSDYAKWYYKAYHNFFKKLMKADQNMSFEKFKEIINDITETGAERIVISGDGEPFLHPQINEMVEYAKNRGLLIAFQTNGMFYDKHFEFFEKVDNLYIHIPSLNDENFARLQTNHVFDKNIIRIRNNIIKLNELRNQGKNMPKIQISAVLNGINYREIYDYFDFASKYGVSYIQFKRLREFNHVPELRLGDREMEEIKGMMLDVMINNKYPNVRSNIPEFLRNYFIDTKASNRIECLVGYHHAYVELSGRVELCCWNPFTVIGNIKQKNFKEIWFSKEAEEMRNKMQNINTDTAFGLPCRVCPLFRINMEMKKSVNNVKKRVDSIEPQKTEISIVETATAA